MGQEDKIQKQESEVRSQNGSREDKIQLQRSGILIAEIRIKNRREKGRNRKQNWDPNIQNRAPAERHN